MPSTSGRCRKAFEVIGDEWILLIISSIRDSSKRFCEIQRDLENLNPITLTNRLRRLEDLRLISRTEGTCGGRSVSYGLTPLGHEALPVIDSIETFSKRLHP